MTDRVDGGCLCGAVRYSASPQEGTAYYCHCRDCQLGSASAFHGAVFSDLTAFELLSGELTTYAKQADSGRMVERKFCTQCGAPICWTGEGFPDVVILSLSSLDDPEGYAPVHEGWTEKALSWARISQNIMSFSGRPVRQNYLLDSSEKET